MRVTAAHAYRARIEAMRRASSDSFDAERVAASGKRIERPSDDPAGFQRAPLLRAMQSDMEAGRRKMDLVRIELSTAEEAFDGMGRILNRMRELTVQMATALTGPEERANAAVEVAKLKESMIALANTRHGDKRLFGGQQTNANPFDATGAYLGDSNAQSVGIADSTTVEVTFAGDAVLRGAAGGPDILQMMDDLETALATNTVADIQDSLGDIDLSIQHVLDYRSQVGSRHALIDSLQAHFEMVEVSLLNDRTAVEGADPLEAFSEVLRTRQAFESATQVSVAARTQSIFELL